MMLLDSNIIIYAAKRDYDDLRRFMVRNAYSVSAVSRVEVLGYHLLGDEQREYLEDFFHAADVLRITDSVVNEAVTLRQSRRMGLGDAIIAGTALAHRLMLVTRNTTDLSWISNLDLINPFESPELEPESS
jgi:predicted nucleic acid-binding protein